MAFSYCLLMGPLVGDVMATGRFEGFRSSCFTRVASSDLDAFVCLVMFMDRVHPQVLHLSRVSRCSRPIRGQGREVYMWLSERARGRTREPGVIVRVVPAFVYFPPGSVHPWASGG